MNFKVGDFFIFRIVEQFYFTPFLIDNLAGTGKETFVTFGEMELPGFPETYRFDPLGSAAVVHPCCVAAAKPAGLRSFFDRRSGERVSGDARIDFSGYVDAEKDGKSFRLSLSEGAASELMSTCEGLSDGVGPCGATPIRTINGIRPDDDGNIVLWFH